MVKLSYNCPCGGVVNYCYYQQGEYKYDPLGKRIHVKGYQVFKCNSCNFIENREN